MILDLSLTYEYFTYNSFTHSKITWHTHTKNPIHAYISGTSTKTY